MIKGNKVGYCFALTSKRGMSCGDKPAKKGRPRATRHAKATHANASVDRRRRSS